MPAAHHHDHLVRHAQRRDADEQLHRALRARPRRVRRIRRAAGCEQRVRARAGPRCSPGDRQRVDILQPVAEVDRRPRRRPGRARAGAACATGAASRIRRLAEPECARRGRRPGRWRAPPRAAPAAPAPAAPARPRSAADVGLAGVRRSRASGRARVQHGGRQRAHSMAGPARGADRPARSAGRRTATAPARRYAWPCPRAPRGS